MEEVILFVLSFFFIFMIYQLFIVKAAKRKKKKREPFEVAYLVKKYRLDLDKIQYNQLLQIIAIVSSLDISLIVSLIMLSDNFIIELLIGFFGTIFIILISYHFVYLFYKRKDMIKK